MITNRLHSFEPSKKQIDNLIMNKQIFELFYARLDKFSRGEIMTYMDLFLENAEQEQLDKLHTDFLFNYIDGKRTVEFLNGKLKPMSKLFVDSGAFSAWTKGKEINVKEYINWLNERSDYLDLFGQIDSIPGSRDSGVVTTHDIEESARKTWENYLFMRKRVNKPEGLLYTFHIGEPIRYLEQALKWKDEYGNYIPYIALGGMVGKSHNIRDAFLEQCFSTIYKLGREDIKVHAFGMTDFDLLKKYPITSADSTSWIMVGAMGNVMTDWGNISVSSKQKNDKNHYSHLPKEEIEKFNELISKYGYTLNELAESRNNRIMFNALYMLEKSNEINEMDRTYKPKRKLF